MERTRIFRGTRLATRSTVALLALSLLSGCFWFNSGSKEGFRVRGVFDGDSNTRIGDCSTADLNGHLFAYTGISFDNPTDPAAGCLQFNIYNTCFPDDASSGFSRVDIRSPELSDWDDIRAYAFGAKTNVSGIHLQPLLRVEDPSGSTYLLREVDSAGDPVFHELTPGTDWELVTFERPGDLDEAVLRVIIRVFVENSTIALYGSPVGGEFIFLQLDAIGPLPPLE